MLSGSWISTCISRHNSKWEKEKKKKRALKACIKHRKVNASVYQISCSSLWAFLLEIAWPSSVKTEQCKTSSPLNCTRKKKKKGSAWLSWANEGTKWNFAVLFCSSILFWIERSRVNCFLRVLAVLFYRSEPFCVRVKIVCFFVNLLLLSCACTSQSCSWYLWFQVTVSIIFMTVYSFILICLFWFIYDLFSPQQAPSTDQDTQLWEAAHLM